MNASQEQPIPSPSQPASVGEFIPDDPLRGHYFEDGEVPNQWPTHGNWMRSKIAGLPYGNGNRISPQRHGDTEVGRRRDHNGSERVKKVQ